MEIGLNLQFRKWEGGRLKILAVDLSVAHWQQLYLINTRMLVAAHAR